MARVEANLPDGLPERAARFAYTLLWGGARVFSIVVLLVAWETLARSGAFTHFQLPPLSDVLVRIWNDAVSGDLLINTSLTLYRALVSFAICAVGGVAIGMAMSRSKIANWFFDPIISVGFPMPKIAFLPVVILWLGVYDVSKITIIVIDAIFPVIAATVIAIQGVERELIWSARNMGASNRELMTQVILPAASPQIMTGLQVALPLTLIVGLALCQFHRRFRRHRRDRGHRLCAGQGDGHAAPQDAGVAPGSQRADDGVITPQTTPNLRYSGHLAAPANSLIADGPAIVWNTAQGNKNN
jgi:ABC-type nitrate/sulfonate/bicarbonate transport system permease component